MVSAKVATNSDSTTEGARIILDMKLQELKELVPQFYISSVICTIFGCIVFFPRLPVLVGLAAAIYTLYVVFQFWQWRTLDIINTTLEKKQQRIKHVELASVVFGISTIYASIALHKVATPAEQIAIMLWAFYMGIGGGMALSVLKRASIAIITLSIAPYALYISLQGAPASQIVAIICIAAVPIAIRQYGRNADILVSLSNQKFEAELEKERSEKNHRTFMMLASDWAWETNANYEITYFSNAGAEFLGINPEDAIGLDIFEATRRSGDDEHQELIVPLLEALEQKTAVTDLQYFAIDGKGQRRTLKTTAVPEFSLNGTLLGYRGWTSDITDKVESQKALIASEQRFKDFTESASDWVWEADADLKYTYISARSLEETGIDHQQFIGLTLGSDTIEMGSDDIDQLTISIKQHIAFKDITRYFEREDGKPVWVNQCGKPVFDDDGKFSGYRGTCRNITAEVEAIKAADESKALVAEANKHLKQEVERQTETIRQRTVLLDEIIDSMTQGLSVFDQNQCIERSNKKAVTLSGLPAKCWAPGQSIADLVAIGCKAGVYDIKSTEEYFEQLYAGIENNGVFEALRHQRDGRIVIESVRARPFGGYVVTYTDITHQKNREHELEELSAELSQSRDAAEVASRTKSSFLANMSHEIRTPMNGVIGMASLLVESKLSPKQQEMAQVIVNSGENLLTIINDILDFSRLEAGKLTIRPEFFNLRRVIEDVAALLTIKVQEKGLEMLVRYDPCLTDYFIGDEARIRQIVTNLVGNAVKFTEDGHILISVVGKNRGEYSDVEICVEDTGCGIPDNKIDSVFQEFEQVDGSSARKHDGTGLGLAITSRLAAAMNGTIGATSTVGKGSVFSVKLPLPNDKNHIDNSTLEVTSTEGLCALIVDNSTVNRTILVEQLAAWGIESVTAGNAIEALRLIEARAANTMFDFAIIDYQMSDMDGEELAKKIRTGQHAPFLPMITLTSIGKKHDPERLRENALFDAYLVKPARASMMFDAINTTIQGASIAKVQQAAEALTESKPRPRRLNSGKGCNVKILIAEDNIVNQMVIKAMLEKLNCEATITNNGREAIDEYQASPPDIVFMDISMPEMDGIEATAQIRKIQEENGVHIPIVGVTAHALKEDRQRCLDAGMDDYLSKPVKREPLMKILAQWTSFMPDKDQTLSA